MYRPDRNQHNLGKLTPIAKSLHFGMAFCAVSALVPLALIAVAGLLVAEAVIGQLIRFLARESRLASILVWWGIIFIVGNYFQLIAMFT
jgi:hypothetical protein